MSSSISKDRVGVCSWSLQASGTDALLEAMNPLDVPLIQLALTPIIENPDPWKDVFSRLSDNGFRIASGMLEAVGEDYSTLESIRATGGVGCDATWPDTRSRAEKVAELASRENIELVTAHAGFIPHDAGDPSRQRILERLVDMADIFASSGIRLGLETGQESAHTLLDVLAEIRHPNVGVNFDPANMILYAMGNPVEAISLLRDSVFQVHAKDALATTTPGTWGTEVPLGTGEVDWDAFLQVVQDLDTPVNVIIEREAGESRIADILAARDRIMR